MKNPVIIISFLVISFTVACKKDDGINTSGESSNASNENKQDDTTTESTPMKFIDPKLLGDVTRWLSKSGELYREDELSELAKKITADQALEFYTYLRDNSERLESEWRESFIALFPQSEGKLPEIAEADRWQSEIFEVIDAGDLQGVKDFIDVTGILENTRFDPNATYQEGRSMGFTDTVDYIPFDFFPVEVENEAGEYPVSYARQKGEIEIADYLQSVIDELGQRYRDAFDAGRKSNG